MKNRLGTGLLTSALALAGLTAFFYRRAMIP
jgi:hypothetical protein